MYERENEIQRRFNTAEADRVVRTEEALHELKRAECGVLREEEDNVARGEKHRLQVEYGLLLFLTAGDALVNSTIPA